MNKLLRATHAKGDVLLNPHHIVYIEGRPNGWVYVRLVDGACLKFECSLDTLASAMGYSLVEDE